jgi:hypothetical protein
VTGEGYPPPAVPISHLAIKRQCAGDCAVGNIVGAIGWRLSPVVALLQGARRCDFGHLSVNYSAAFISGLGRLRASLKTVTWLILPVVICLSQRLSHACLSISNLYRETANGSLNQLSFI